MTYRERTKEHPCVSRRNSRLHQRDTDRAGNSDPCAHTGEYETVQERPPQRRELFQTPGKYGDCDPRVCHSRQRTQDQPDREIVLQAHRQGRYADCDQAPADRGRRLCSHADSGECAQKVTNIVRRRQPSSRGDRDSPVVLHHGQYRGEGKAADSHRYRNGSKPGERRYRARLRVRPPHAKAELDLRTWLESKLTRPSVEMNN